MVHPLWGIDDDDIPCQIEEGLFLGSVGAAKNWKKLKDLNVTHMLTVANSLPPKYPNHFVYKVLNVEDRITTDLRQHFNECFNYIEEAKTSGGGVLVHSFAGSSRSATIVLSYLMKKHRMSLYQAFEHVKRERDQRQNLMLDLFYNCCGTLKKGSVGHIRQTHRPRLADQVRL
ncbi:putative phosphoric monoester hydrolase [Rosa chinensis]|uniref:protein-tyrosine-phosphatase n=1 Tax=Rosa chinensis TaxID=74649 RepID=A0A2P6PCD8_ROSCH|nr:putative phosphoric monoester hydrolase [Rosa chinensis]